ncbi:MAG: hypothetical protein H7Y42_04095 [Chitinophagaceae bacterium]|nr:hypothetical protein [Chitinophagaceae bacterium]
MSTHNQTSKGSNPEPVPVPPECKQDDTNPTQIVINKERNKYCLELYEARGATSQQEVKFAGENEIYNDRKCLFNNTEENYLRYRNLEITIGTEMLTTSETIKGNVDQLKKWNSDLNALLKKLSKSVKDAKEKFKDLKDAGCKLESSIHDQCFTAQWKALTGRESEKCDATGEPHPACKTTAEDISAMICRPKGLILDIDSITTASADVVGIQIFSNIDTLEPLHKELDTYSKDFEKHVAEVMKTRETDLKKMQDDLVKSVKDITKAAVDRNSLRGNFEGLYDAVSYMCCPPCVCVGPIDPSDPDCHDNNYRNKQGGTTPAKDCYNDCPSRLKKCEKAICEICTDVKVAFCCDTPPVGDPGIRGCCD